MMDDKIKKKHDNLCTKITQVFTDLYITKQGYILSKSKEKPFIIQLDEEQVKWFEEANGEFNILHISKIREYKKTGECVEKVTSKTETSEILQILEERLGYINQCDKWEKFILSQNDDENEKLIMTLFKMNNYIDFHPSDNPSSPELILTKSLLPLVSEKNYTDLYYASKTVGKNLFMIVFDFQFTMFRLYMIHHYIPIKKEDTH